VYGPRIILRWLNGGPEEISVESALFLNGDACDTPKRSSPVNEDSTCCSSNLPDTSKNLGIPEALGHVIVDHAGGLHERVADRRADEAEPTLLQVFA
jgi:hypothetical protein